MDCKKDCDKWNMDFGFCSVCSTKPSPTGDPRTCPYFNK